jgi:hypothetical protein
MTMLRRALPLLAFLSLAPLGVAVGQTAKDGVRRVEIAAARIKLADIVPELAAIDLDLGPAPAPGTSRIVTREDIQQALKEQRVEGVGNLPHAVRVSRKMETIEPERMRALSTAAIDGSGLRRGVRLKSLQPPASIKVASGWETVSALVPKSPRRAGEWSTTVMVAFDGGGQRLARVAVAAVFDVSAEGAAPDVSKGAAITLVVKTGLVEISTKAVANDNADVGDTLPVMLRPSGKVVRAKLIAKDRALLEGTNP